MRQEMIIELEHGKHIFENPDFCRWECTSDQSHTLKEWIDFAMEYTQHRITIKADNRIVLEDCNGKIEKRYCEELDNYLFDIYQMSDSWGQITFYLRRKTFDERAKIVRNTQLTKGMSYKERLEMQKRRYGI